MQEIDRTVKILRKSKDKRGRIPETNRKTARLTRKSVDGQHRNQRASKSSALAGSLLAKDPNHAQ